MFSSKKIFLYRGEWGWFSSGNFLKLICLKFSSKPLTLILQALMLVLFKRWQWTILRSSSFLNFSFNGLLTETLRFSSCLEKASGITSSCYFLGNWFFKYSDTWPQKTSRTWQVRKGSWTFRVSQPSFSSAIICFLPPLSFLYIQLTILGNYFVV